jgi:hypothetical protein
VTNKVSDPITTQTCADVVMECIKELRDFRERVQSSTETSRLFRAGIQASIGTLKIKFNIPEDL